MNMYFFYNKENFLKAYFIDSTLQKSKKAFYYESYMENMKVQVIPCLNHKPLNTKENNMDCRLHIFERQLVI